jgi:succinoglycan biosynthesis transport protein ExoP
MGEDGEQSLEIQGLLHALLRRSWVIVLLALISGLAAGAHVRRLPSLYQSTAVIEVESREQKPVNIQDGSEQNLQNPEVVETIIEDFRHRFLMERVAKTLDLAHDAEFLGYTPTQPVSDDAIVGMLLSSSNAALQPRTRLVKVSYVHTNPKVSQKIANALVEQFLRQGMEQRMKATEVQNQVLQQKSNELKEKLRHSEEALQDYKKKLESVSVEDQRNMVEEKLKSLNSDVNMAKSERLSLESDVGTVKQAKNNPQQLLAITSIAQDPQVMVAQQQLAKAEGDLAALLQRYRERWPGVKEQRAQVENAQQNLKNEVLAAPGRLDGRYKAALTKEKGLEQAAREQEKALLELEDKVIPYRALQREYDADRTLFESVLQQLKANTLTLGVQPALFHVVEPAIPGTPMASKRLFKVIGVVIMSTLLAAGAIAGLFFLDSSIRTVDSAERLLGLPVLAGVPTMRKTSRANDLLPLIHDPGSPVAESYRTLRSALALLGPESTHRVILFTSALAGEGKSVTATNTAIAFAQQGLRTALVEADLRKPTIAKHLFGMGDKLLGIADYMVGRPAAIQPTHIENLFLMPAGSRAPNPAELLMGSHFGEIIEWLKNDFDRIVIDTAPVNVVSDTLNIVSCASIICLVVRSNSTPRRVVRRAIELLQRAKVRPDGIVLNCLPRWNGLGYHYYYSGESKYGDEGTYGDSYNHDDGSPQKTDSGNMAKAKDDAEAVPLTRKD